MDEANIPDESVAQFLSDLQTIRAEDRNASVPRDNIATIDTLEEYVLKNSSEIVNSSINMLKDMERVVQTVQGAEEMSA